MYLEKQKKTKKIGEFSPTSPFFFCLAGWLGKKAGYTDSPYPPGYQLYFQARIDLPQQQSRHMT